MFSPPQSGLYEAFPEFVLVSPGVLNPPPLPPLSGVRPPRVAERPFPSSSVVDHSDEVDDLSDLRPHSRLAFCTGVVPLPQPPPAILPLLPHRRVWDRYSNRRPCSCRAFGRDPHDCFALPLMVQRELIRALHYFVYVELFACDAIYGKSPVDLNGLDVFWCNPPFNLLDALAIDGFRLSLRPSIWMVPYRPTRHWFLMLKELSIDEVQLNKTYTQVYGREKPRFVLFHLGPIEFPKPVLRS